MTIGPRAPTGNGDYITAEARRPNLITEMKANPFDNQIKVTTYTTPANYSIIQGSRALEYYHVMKSDHHNLDASSIIASLHGSRALALKE